MPKLIDNEQLKNLANGLNSHISNKVVNEKTRAMEVENNLATEISRVEGMFGGKSLVYITQAQYDLLTEEEKNSNEKTYFITDAVDLSHTHENKDFLDNLEETLDNLHSDKFEELNAKLVNKVDKEDGKSLMTDAERTKLNSLSNYSHPEHTAKVSGLYKVTIDNLGHVSAAKLVSKADITALGIPEQDTVYTHPETHPATMITEDITHRFVTDAEKSTWNNKAEKTVASTNADGLMAKADKSKLDSIDMDANNYSHPATHNAGMIEVDAEHQFVTLEQIKNWNAKASTAVATASVDGLMSRADKSKLAGIEAEANKYILTKAEIEKKLTGTISSHNHDGQYYTETEIDGKVNTLNTAISNAQTAAQNYADQKITALVDSAPDAMNTLNELAEAIQSHGTEYEAYVATVSADLAKKVDKVEGQFLMTTAERDKLQGIAEGATNFTYTHPSHTAAKSGLYKVTVDNKGHVTATSAVVKADITALGIPAQDTTYTHPSSHSASMITEDKTHRFVTDTEKSTWNAKSNLALGTSSSTAFRGDYGNTAYNHSQTAHAPSNAQKNSDITLAEINAKLTGDISAHNHDGMYYTEAEVDSLLEGKANSSHGTHVTYATVTPKANGTAAVGTSSKVAREDHIHPLQTTISGNAGSATKVNNNMVVKLNGGTKEGTNLFTFNGSAAKTVNITPDSIGAAAASHGTHLTLGTSSSTAFRGDYGNTAYNHSQAAHAPSNAQKNSDITKAEIEAKLTGSITSHTHNYASKNVASTTAAGLMSAADKAKLDSYEIATEDEIIALINSLN